MSLIHVVVAASAAGAVAQHKAPPKAGGRAGTKRAWFRKLQAQAPTCSRCRFDSGMWLGYVPSVHSCGKGIA